MEIKPGEEKNWKKSTDLSDIEKRQPGDFPPEYYQAIIDFAVSWAERMEAGLALGLRLADIWKDTQKGAKEYHELTGFMFNTAVILLVSFWVYGEELRELHNATFGYDGEGTVNGAIFIVGGRMIEEPTP